MLSTLLACAAAAIALGALGYAHRCYLVAARSAPNQLTEGFAQLRQRMESVEAESTSVRANQVQWIAEITGLMESVEGCLSQIETKRRKTAAAAARLGTGNGAQPTDPASMDRPALMQLARERGIFGDG